MRRFDKEVNEAVSPHEVRRQRIESAFLAGVTSVQQTTELEVAAILRDENLIDSIAEQACSQLSAGGIDPDSLELIEARLAIEAQDKAAHSLGAPAEAS
jgi:hypothetical protein